MTIKNLREKYLKARNEQNEHVRQFSMGKNINMKTIGNLALKTRTARNTLHHAAAKKIQNTWRNKKMRYILVFKKSNLNMYTKIPKKVLSSQKSVFKLKGYPYPNDPSKKIFMIPHKNNSKGTKVSIIFRALKNVLPNHMLPNIEKVRRKNIFEKLRVLNKAVGVIKHGYFPVRKIIYILKKTNDEDLKRAAIMMENLNMTAVRYTEHIKKLNPSINFIKKRIFEGIGVCHINTTLRNNPSLNKVTYLINYRNQMIEACKQLVKKPESKWIPAFKFALGGRPCLENLVDALTQVAFGEVKWKGLNKALNLTKNNNKNHLKHVIIGTFMKNHVTSLGGKKNYTKNRLWHAIKNKPLYVWKNNGPKFVPVKNISNTRKISNNAFNEYINYV